eukprot:NP_508746.1 Uncharacterized protein CELE_F14H12.2 [Caenorhabditis elegans]
METTMNCENLGNSGYFYPKENKLVQPDTAARHSQTQYIHVLNDQSVSKIGGFQSEIQPNAEQPGRYLLLQNRPYKNLCWLNTMLNVLFKSTSFSKKFIEWQNDKSISNELGNIFNKNTKSASKLRSMMDKDFRKGPQAIPNAFPAFLKNLNMDLQEKDVTYCRNCNTLFHGNIITNKYPHCGNEKMIEGKLFQWKESIFVVTKNVFKVKRLNKRFEVYDAYYVLAAFGEFIDGKVCGHYVSWIRKHTTNCKESHNVYNDNDNDNCFVNDYFDCVNDEKLNGSTEKQRNSKTKINIMLLMKLENRLNDEDIK